MVKGRMLNVIKYLEKHKETGYRQIAEAMDETTRAVSAETSIDRKIAERETKSTRKS